MAAIPSGQGVAVGDLVDGVVDRPADADVGDRPGPRVGPEDQEHLAPRGFDRQATGPLRVGPQGGDWAALTWLVSDRSAVPRSIARWIEETLMSSLIWIRSTQALRSGSVAGSQLGLRTSTTVSPGT